MRDQVVRKPLTPRAAAAMTSRSGRGVERGHEAEPEWPVGAAPGMTQTILTACPYAVHHLRGGQASAPISYQRSAEPIAFMRYEK